MSNLKAVKKSVSIDAELVPVLELMLKKASLQLSDINDTFIRVWINQNPDLLTEAEKRKFKITQKMGEPITNYVFIDTNVLINDFFYRYNERNQSKSASIAVQFLRAKPKVNLYVASFSLVQLISTLDRAKVPHSQITKEISRLLGRFKLIDLTAKDFESISKTTISDIEDALQYTLCRKPRCFYIITDNVKDFRGLLNIVAIRPKYTRKVIF